MVPTTEPVHLYPPFTWTPQKWVEPGVEPTSHLSHAHLEPGSTRVLHPSSTRLRRLVELVSKRVRGVRENGQSRTNADRCPNPSCAERLEQGQYPRQLQSLLRNKVPYKKIAAELGNAVHRKWNVGLPILKFLCHSASSHPATMRSKNV